MDALLANQRFQKVCEVSSQVVCNIIDAENYGSHLAEGGKDQGGRERLKGNASTADTTSRMAVLLNKAKL